MTAKLLKIGEFAKLCRTTKDTILHYEKKGLLKPIFIDINNYRYYDIYQFFVFDRIKFLQDAGYSLDDIKHTQGQNFDSQATFIENSLHKLLEQKKHIELKEKMLRISLGLIDEMSSCQYDKLSFVKLNLFHLLGLHIDDSKEIKSMSDLIRVYKKTLNVILEKENYEQLILGISLDLDAFPKFKIKNILCSDNVIDSSDFSNEKILEDLYAVYYHQDDFKGHLLSIVKIFQRLQKLNYKILSIKIIDIYSIFSGESDNKIYKAKYLFQVKK